MQGLVGGRWGVWVLGAGWALSLLLLFSHMNSRLQDLHNHSARLNSIIQNHIQQSSDQSGRSHGLKSSSLQNNDFIIYNRIPKTASTTFANAVIYALHKSNGYHALGLNVSRNQHTLSLPDQVRFLENMTHWSQRRPAIYHGHVSFINFARLGYPNPIYINILREPLDRFVSYYYFIRYGDKYRPNIVRKKAGNDETLDECVERGGKDCKPDNLWLQIPFFCGHSPDCWVPGNPWALEEAKRNLVEHYFLVGVVEELRDFITLLEFSLPRFFNGAIQSFDSGSHSFLRQTKKKVEPSVETVAEMKKSEVYKMESEFYEFARRNFISVRDRMTKGRDRDGNLVPRGLEFYYQKVKPKIPYEA